jgi:hypothetical protein
VDDTITDKEAFLKCFENVSSDMNKFGQKAKIKTSRKSMKL